MDPIKIIAALTPIATIVATAFALYFWFENRYVHLEPEFKSLEKRFEIKVKSDYIRELNSRIWTLEDRLKVQSSDRSAKEELRDLKEKKRNANVDLEAIKR